MYRSVYARLLAARNRYAYTLLRSAELKIVFVGILSDLDFFFEKRIESQIPQPSSHELEYVILREANGCVRFIYCVFLIYIR